MVHVNATRRMQCRYGSSRLLWIMFQNTNFCLEIQVKYLLPTAFQHILNMTAVDRSLQKLSFQNLQYRLFTPIYFGNHSFHKPFRILHFLSYINIHLHTQTTQTLNYYATAPQIANYTPPPNNWQHSLSIAVTTVTVSFIVVFTDHWVILPNTLTSEFLFLSGNQNFVYYFEACSFIVVKIWRAIINT
jgi:hypothetical protein